MKPIIGITMSLEQEQKQHVSREYSDAVIQAGGVPLLLPYTTDSSVLHLIANQLDGLILSGGGDINPTLFGEEPHPGLGEIVPERDKMEINLINQMIEESKPIFGICRGCQILNVALGGDMIQDLPGQKSQLIQHSQRAPRSHASHTIEIEENSLLHQIFKKTSIKVNSFHHQAVRFVPSTFKVTARSADGVIEAFESLIHAFVLGVQWHPESMAKIDADSRQLFQAFVNVATAL